jgi:hypothetical protein
MQLPLEHRWPLEQVSGVPMQTPAWQVSFCVQELLSLQDPPVLAELMHIPLPAWHCPT